MLASDRFAALLSRGHRLCRNPSVTWRDLASEPFIALSHDTSVRLYTDRAFAQADITVETIIECANSATVGGLVASGLGVSALPSLVHPLMNLAGLVSRRLTGPVVSRDLCIVTRTGRVLSPAAAELVAHLVTKAPEIMSQAKLALQHAPALREP